MVDWILDVMENEPTATAHDIAKITLLDSILNVDQAWRPVKSDGIVNCWMKGGLQLQAPPEEGNNKADEMDELIPEGWSVQGLDKDLETQQSATEADVIDDVKRKFDWKRKSRMKMNRRPRRIRWQFQLATKCWKPWKLCERDCFSLMPMSGPAVEAWSCCGPHNQKWNQTAKHQPILSCWTGAGVKKQHPPQQRWKNIDSTVLKMRINALILV